MVGNILFGVEFSAYFIRSALISVFFLSLALPVDILEVFRNFGPILSGLFGLVKKTPDPF